MYSCALLLIGSKYSVQKFITYGCEIKSEGDELGLVCR